MKRIFSVFQKKEWILSIGAILLILIGAIFDILSPYFFSHAMNNIAAQFEGIKEAIKDGIMPIPKVEWQPSLILYFSLMILFPFLTIACTISSIFLATRASVTVTTRVRQSFYEKSLYLSSLELDRITGSSIVTRATMDTQQILSFLIMFFSTFVKSISLIIGGLTLSLVQLAQFDGTSNIWYLAFVYLLFPILAVSVGLLVRKGIPLFKKTRYAIDDNNTIMQENIMGNRLVRAFNMQEAQSVRYERGNVSLRDRSIKSDNIFVVISPIIGLIMNISTIMIFMFSGLYSKNAGTSPEEIKATTSLVGIVQAFIQYFLQMLVGLSLLGMVMMVYGRARASAGRVYEVIDSKNPIVSGTVDKKIENGSIEFKNVNFKYNEDDAKYVLNNINFKAEKGQTVGILGQTGSGKTSLVNLLLRLYDTSEGDILIDDVNIKDYQLKNLRAGITMAMQEKVLIRGTVRSNILIGNQNASEEEIIRAAKDAQAYEFINKLPDKFDAPVEQKGKNFSGGQQQRISIARALIKKSKILVFDDSTSALDNMTETKLLSTLKDKYADQTKIIISQKVRTVKNADIILVLKNGQVAEEGQHQDLLKKKGLYYSIYESQESSMEK